MSREKKNILTILGVVLFLGIGLYFLLGALSSEGENASDPVVLEEAEPDYGLLPEIEEEPEMPEAPEKETSSNSEDNIVNVEDEFAAAETAPAVVETITNTTTTSTTAEPDIVVPPPPPSIGGDEGLSSRSTARFYLRGDLGASFRCSLNRRGFAGAKRCGEEREYKYLRDGEHVFRAWQITDSGISGVAAKRIWIDTKPPAAPKFTKVPGEIINKRSAIVRWTGSKKNSFECSLTDPRGNRESRVCGFGVSIKNMKDGEYSFSVRQIDRAGNGSDISRTSWIVDTVAPKVPKITSGPANNSSLASDEVQFSFTGEEGASFRCDLSGNGESRSEECISPYTYLDLSPGTYTFSLRQQDYAGNWSPAISRSFTLTAATLASRGLKSDSRNELSDPSTAYASDSGGGGPYIPTPQEVSQESNLSLDVLAAIELSAIDDSESSASAAPASDDLITSEVLEGTAVANFSVSAQLRSNLSWVVQSSETQEEGIPDNKLSGARPLLAELNDTDYGNNNGLRNRAPSAGGNEGANGNGYQTYSEDYTQDVSWGDEAGQYTITLTHVASQTIPSE